LIFQNVRWFFCRVIDIDGPKVSWIRPRPRVTMFMPGAPSLWLGSPPRTARKNVLTLDLPRA
jgi:hypothetical protein